MYRIYSSPIRVYLFLGILALVGLWAGDKLPVSMFPNSVRPTIGVSLKLSGYTPESFRDEVGSEIESSFKKLNTKTIQLDEVKASYNKSGNIDYNLKFSWKTDASEAMKEVEGIMRAYSERFPSAMRDSLDVYSRGESRSKGFYAASIYSTKRSLDEVYNIVEPILRPKLKELKDSESASLWNPAQEKIYVTPKFSVLSSLGVSLFDIEKAIKNGLSPTSGGNIEVQDVNYKITIPRKITDSDQLADTLVLSPNGTSYRLEDLAKIEKSVSKDFGFRTSGNKSIILFATPKDDGNIKRLSDEINEITKQVLSTLPPDIEFATLIDPGQFIQSSVNHVKHEVFLGALLAVIILYLFIGSARNVITATIEIPLSLILSFILMKIFDMNLNIISLGGLALSSGMNVDASVVVLENIMRKFEGHVINGMSKETRLKLIIEAVREVSMPLLASTFASLVVFIPIIFTSDLTYAILGDLAKAVVFSHLFSAVIALLLVPSVRYHLMGSLSNKSSSSQNEHSAPLDKPLAKVEKWYEQLLNLLIFKKSRLILGFSSLFVTLALLVVFALPTLPKEIIGKPDSNIIGLWFRNSSVKNPQQQDSVFADLEQKIKDTLKDNIGFIFSQGQGQVTNGTILIFIKDKSKMNDLKILLEDTFKSDDTKTFDVFDFNPGELSVPNPPPIAIEMVTGTVDERSKVLSKIRNELTLKVPEFREINMPSDSRVSKELELIPKPEIWNLIQADGFNRAPSDLLFELNRSIENQSIGQLTSQDKRTEVEMSKSLNSLTDLQEIGSFPINWKGRILPLNSLFDMKVNSRLYQSQYLDGGVNFKLEAWISEKHLKDKEKIILKAKKIYEDWQRDNPTLAGTKWLESEIEINSAINELLVACAWSVALIFLTMYIQFGTLVEALLVLMAIPLALIGVFISLTVFKSSLSLNSVLGIILLNGISVANSILLVDFAKNLFASGQNAKSSIIEASQKRLRPILITSFTTILAMLPIALGLGEGGKVLQPLGIAVSGGLCVSMILTLIFVPALHYNYLNWQAKKENRA